MQPEQKYRWCYKTDIANAYGFSYGFLHAQLEAGEKKVKGAFGEWRGRKLLHPAQVKAIVQHLGEPNEYKHIASS